jgi:site-specific DNA recombinase
VHKIFSLYLELGCVRGLKIRLDQEGVRSKVRTRSVGKRSGGCKFSRGALYKILNNRIYLGEVSHKGQCHPGEHEAIISRELWDQVHTQLRDHNQGRRNGVKAESASLLTGYIFDGEGNKLTASHAVKSGRRYRYYCQAVSQQDTGRGSSIRIPANDIESRVLAKIVEFLRSEKELLDQLGKAEETAESIQDLLTSAANMSRILKTGSRTEISEVTRKLVHRVVVQPERVQIQLKKKDLRGILLKEHSQDQVSGHIISLELAARLARRGREIRLVVSPAAEKAPAYQSQALLKAVARAHEWRERLITGQAAGLQAIAKQSGLDESYVRRILGFAFLAPDIVESILDGRQPHDLTLEKLRTRLPMNWVEQRQMILHSE